MALSPKAAVAAKAVALAAIPVAATPAAAIPAVTHTRAAAANRAE